MNKSGDIIIPEQEDLPILETMGLYYKENILDHCFSPSLSLHHFLTRFCF